MEQFHSAAQALRGTADHPAIVWLGPVCGVMERTAAGWRMDHRRWSTPQEARDSLGSPGSALVPVLDSPLKGQRQGEVCRRQTERQIEFRRQAGHLRGRAGRILGAPAVPAGDRRARAHAARPKAVARPMPPVLPAISTVRPAIGPLWVPVPP